MALQPCTWATVEGKGGRKFRIERLLATDYDECVRHVSEAFTYRNKMVAACGGVTLEDAGKYAELKYRRQCLNSGLSVVARDDESGTIAAFLFLEAMDILNDKKPDVGPMLMVDEVGTTLYIEAWRGSARETFGPIVRGKVLHISTGATIAEYEGTGVGFALRNYMEAHAAKHGFERVIVEPGHPATRHIYENKLGYQVCHSLMLNTFVAKDGSRPFEGLDATEQIAICQKVLTRSPACRNMLPMCLYWSLRLAGQV